MAPSRGKAALAMLVAGALAILPGCGTEDKGVPASTNRKLIVASEATFPPMEYVDDENKIVGFDIDLINAVAKEAGLEIEIQNVAWDGIFGALQSGNADIIVSSVTITDERKAQFDFTDPYLKAGQVLLVRSADKETYKDLAALAGKKVGVQVGTTAAEFVQKQQKHDMKAYNTAGLAIMDLANAGVDGVVVDKPVADYHAHRKPEFANKLTVVSEPQTDESFGFVVRKGETELLEKLNKGLAKLKADGTLQKIESQWFR